jgi:hypothetical protein
MIICSSLSVQAQVVPTEEWQEVRNQFYYNEDLYVEHFVKADNIQQTGKTITFRVGMNLDGSEPQNSSVVFVINEKTLVPEKTSEISPDLEAFVCGERPWIGFYLTKEETEQALDGKLDTVYVQCVYNTSAAIAFYPNPEEKNKFARLASYGIMVGDENGDVEPIRELTRSELAKIAVMMQNPDFTQEDPYDVVYMDLDKNHWAYPYVAYATKEGILCGYPDGSFRPEALVTYAEVMKVMTHILGYAPQAETLGGYPHGYWKTAKRLGLFQGLNFLQEENITRKEMAHLACLVLETPLMQPKEIESDTYVILDGNTPKYPLLTLEIKNFQ